MKKKRLSEEEIQKIKKLVRFGFKNYEVAKFFNINLSTLHRVLIKCGEVKKISIEEILHIVENDQYSKLLNDLQELKKCINSLNL